jgi:hypothetical protein
MSYAFIRPAFFLPSYDFLTLFFAALQDGTETVASIAKAKLKNGKGISKVYIHKVSTRLIFVKSANNNCDSKPRGCCYRKVMIK